MPRQRLSYKKKSIFRGNKFTKPVNVSMETLSDETRPTVTAIESRPIEEQQSSSAKKISFEKYDTYDSSGNGNCIFSIDMLSEAIKAFVQCQFCQSKDSIELTISHAGKSGLAVNAQLKCNACSKYTSFQNSPKLPNVQNKFDINVRFVYAMRTIGKGQDASNVLCALLDLPSPPQKFGVYNKMLCEAVGQCAEESMVRATNEAIIENGGCKDLAVAVDGSWQKRGHTSMNGFISVTSVDTGKVLDVSVLSKYCQICISSKNKNVLANHDCTKNYEGPSGSMEVVGAVQVFRNSVNRGVRYTRYLGDGDSKGFAKVMEDEPYGEGVEIEKLECVNHVKKRMGARLTALKRDFKGKKFDDGKGIGGKNRLTKVQIYKLQDYYGLAIIRGLTSVEDMRKNIWATYFHRLSTDEKPTHQLCPTGEDSWCGFNKAKALNLPYCHKNNLPEPILLAMKKIYQDLSKPELLKKCLHGGTQNPNESFNHVVWTKIPKGVFVRLVTLKLGVFDSVISFNDGFTGKMAIYQHLGLKLNKESVNVLKTLDLIRYKKAEKEAEYATKEARLSRKLKRKVQEEKEDQNQDPEYGAGMF